MEETNDSENSSDCICMKLLMLLLSVFDIIYLRSTNKTGL
jgi:hypothetical protein